MNLPDRDPLGGSRCDISIDQLHSMGIHELALPDPLTPESARLGIMLTAAEETRVELGSIPYSLAKTIQDTWNIVRGQALDRLDGRYPL